MRLSCLPVSLYANLATAATSTGEWFRLAGSLGLDGADLSVAQLPNRSPAALDAVRRQAEDCGLPIVMLATYSDFTHPDAVERSRQRDEVCHWIDAADRLGTKFLRVTAGQAHPGLDEPTGLGWAVDGLIAGLDHAAKAGV